MFFEMLDDKNKLLPINTYLGICFICYATDKRLFLLHEWVNKYRKYAAKLF